MTKLGMAVDLHRCIGCNTCALACKMQNNVPDGMLWNRVLTEGCEQFDGAEGTYPNLTRTYLPIACQHCDNPACQKVCPTGATYTDDKGRVEIDYEKCIGCRMCINACPYNARSYHDVDQSATPYYEGYEMTPYEEMRASEHPIGVVEKCVMCKERTAQGEEPSCVKTCITKSRWFGDLDDPTSEINVMIKKLGAKPLMEDLGTKPSVYYAGLV